MTTARASCNLFHRNRRLTKHVSYRGLVAGTRSRRYCRGRGIRRGGWRWVARRRARRGSRSPAWWRAWWRARRVDSGGFAARVVVVSRTRLDDSRASAPTTRRTARGERAGDLRRSPRSRIRSPRRITATPRRCATPTLVPATPASPPHPSLSRSRSAARRRSPRTFPPPRRLADSGRGGARRGRRDSSTYPRA